MSPPCGSNRPSEACAEFACDNIPDLLPSRRRRPTLQGAGRRRAAMPRWPRRAAPPPGSPVREALVELNRPALRRSTPDPWRRALHPRREGCARQTAVRVAFGFRNLDNQRRRIRFACTGDSAWPSLHESQIPLNFEDLTRAGSRMPSNPGVGRHSRPCPRQVHPSLIRH